MGVNMAGNCIVDDAVCCQASRMEILRRYYTACVEQIQGKCDVSTVSKLKLLMNQAEVTPEIFPAVSAALSKAEATGAPAGAMVLPDGTVITGKTSSTLGAASALLLNALKHLAGIDDSIDLISAQVLEPICQLKTDYLSPQEPPAPYRRGAHCPDHLRPHQSRRPKGQGAAVRASGLRGPFLRGAEPGGRKLAQESGHSRFLRSEVRKQPPVPQVNTKKTDGLNRSDHPFLFALMKLGQYRINRQESLTRDFSSEKGVKPQEYFVYFKVLQTKSWRKRSVRIRRRICAVLP